MSSISRSAQGAEVFNFSKALKRGVSSLTGSALVRIDIGTGNLVLTTQDTPKPPQRSGLATRLSVEQVRQSPGRVRSFSAIGPSSSRLGWLASQTDDLVRWSVFEVTFDSGMSDQIAIRLNGGEHDQNCGNVLAAIWPILREDCLEEAWGPKSIPGADALLWMISKNVGAAILILDSAGRVIMTNASGSGLLAQGTILQEVSGELRCATMAETKALRHGIRECLAQPCGSTVEMILFLEVIKGEGRVPLSLSRYDSGTAGPMIVAVLPQRPDPKRIELLAQKMGLTPSEARVASLMQLGLSNREAAYIAGLKEQTFNTYAKRVLSKLNVSCRAEMAHMLTWQAGLGHAS